MPDYTPAEVRAMRRLSQTGELTTSMLKPLRLPFEFFLKVAQYTPQQWARVLNRVRRHLAHYQREK